MFRNKSGKELWFDYHANGKLWMTRVLFFDWLKRFYSFIGMKNSRKVLLVLENCTAHGNNDVLPSLRNVKVRFLPPSATSQIQPCDAGIIACVKRVYKNRLLIRLL